MKVTPGAFDGLSTTSVVLAGNFELENGVPLHAEDGWPMLSIEAQMRTAAIGVVACGGTVQLEQIILSGGLQARRTDGSEVDESETMEHFFRQEFGGRTPAGVILVKDAGCKTTKSSAQSVGALLEGQIDPTVPIPAITSASHVHRARKTFAKETGQAFQFFAAEDILRDAGAFGWNKEASAAYAQYATDYLRSRKYHEALIRETIYRLATAGPLESIAERVVVGHRTTK